MLKTFDIDGITFTADSVEHSKGRHYIIASGEQCIKAISFLSGLVLLQDDVVISCSEYSCKIISLCCYAYNKDDKKVMILVDKI